MNKQFSDLFDKAVMEQCLANGDSVDNSQAILERFAELIVNDAVELVRDIMRDEESELSLMAGAEVQARMREYFGVEA